MIGEVALMETPGNRSDLFGETERYIPWPLVSSLWFYLGSIINVRLPSFLRGINTYLHKIFLYKIASLEFD